MKKILLFVVLSSIFLSCKKTDKDIIIGRWQSERDWFEFKNDLTYSSGKDQIKMVDHYKYSIDQEKKELNLYTDDKNTTYYLIYELKGMDSLSVRNAMSTNKTMINFIRKIGLKDESQVFQSRCDDRSYRKVHTSKLCFDTNYCFQSSALGFIPVIKVKNTMPTE